MTKWIIAVGLVCVSATAYIFWQSTQGSREGNGDSLLEYVPADTIYYLGGKSTAEFTEFFNAIPMNSSLPSQSAQFDTIMQSLNAGNSKPGKFFMHLIEAANNLENGSIGTFMQWLGVAKTGAFAIYSHGIAPVVRFELSSPAALLKLIDDAVAVSDWQYQEEIIDTNRIRLWQLTDADEAVTLYFVISTNDHTATLTFISSVDDDATKWERLGLTKPQNSIVTSKELESLKNTYGFNDFFNGFIHFERIANGFINPEQNAFGRQLQQYLPEEAKNKINQSLTTECRKDFASLAAGMPRAIFGYEDIQLSGNTMDMAVNTILEIKNPAVNLELNKIRGHIPAHALSASDKIAHFGAGINSEQLTPALTSLWALFVNADFSCEKLQQQQDLARKSNPAMLGMFLAMAQGVKGMGFSLYDISWGQGGLTPETVSALISVSAEDPQTLAGMTAMVPMLAGIQIPSDGSAVDIPLPMVPATISLKAAIKGKHLVVYSGDDLQAQLSALETEDLSPNGIYSFGINYRRLADLAQINLNGLGGASACMMQQEFAHILNQMPMDLSYLLDSSANGIEGKISITMDKPELSSISFPGKYTLEFLNDSCQWQASGIDEVNADGTGRYAEQDENKECEVYISEYNWTQKSDRIVISPSREAKRENCSAAFEEQELKAYDCLLLNVKADQFQCLFDAGTEEASLYRYQNI